MHSKTYMPKNLSQIFEYVRMLRLKNHDPAERDKFQSPLYQLTDQRYNVLLMEYQFWKPAT